MHFNKLYNYAEPLVAAATVLGASFILVGLIAGYTAYSIKIAGDTVSVTGSARQAVTADYGRLTLTIEAKTGINDQDAGFKRLEVGANKIVSYLEKEGMTDVELPAPYSGPQYYYPQNSAPVMTGYLISRTIVVRSENVDKLRELANSIAPFSGAGYAVMINGIELTYQKLDDMRVELLAKAIADAKARANAIATESGRRVGALRSSSSGVVQVLPKGGIDISDYGTYDTQNMEKEVMVTVRATFSLR